MGGLREESGPIKKKKANMILAEKNSAPPKAIIFNIKTAKEVWTNYD